MDNERIQAVYDSQTHRIAGRLMKGVDLFTGIKEVCQNFNVESAQLQCLGSLEYATYLQIVRGDTEGTLKYSEKKRSSSGVEILSGTGFVGYGEDRELDVHFHGMFIDCDHQISGGHFLNGENPTAVLIEFILFPLPEIALKRGIDPHWNMPSFQFKKKE
ncbi:PCC domain-containing protein [Paenisporosarcina sp. TG20]|uniref:PCC domain-containing protein n=1 Tax=Paenisporosarcina sp. TG20 TaxID=1211706 RepID=UPI0002E78929|nr:PPC domain-containing DNA-binding protein [Paenisporosarcina sp. TG20]